MSLAQFTQAAQVSLGMHDHPCRTLNERFHDNGCDLARMLLEPAFDFTQTRQGTTRTFQLERTAIAVWNRRADRRKQEWQEHRMESIHAADAYIAECIAVVGSA